MRLSLALVLLAALPTACAAPSAPVATAPTREAPLSYPPSVRERVLRFALAEWEEWGRITVEPGQRRLHASAGGGPESSLDAFPRVLAYWRAVDDASGVIERNRGRFVAALGGAGGGTWGEPAWSAAFVSWVMRSAGVDRREFAGSAAHAFYLDAMLADARDFPATAPFVPHGWTERAPEPGDLVCADRSRRPLALWQDRLSEAGRFRPMHCDIVVNVTPGTVQAVGGNVADAVTMVRYAADGTGRLLPRPAGEPTLFAVFENRLGRLPPFPAYAPATAPLVAVPQVSELEGDRAISLAASGVPGR